VTDEPKYTAEKQKSGWMQFRLWDVIVSVWVVVIATLGDLAQWGLENLVPSLKSNSTQGMIWGAVAFGLCTLVVRFVRNNSVGDKGQSVFPLTPPAAMIPTQSTNPNEEKK
jgi:multisubunit Na+/H+ antiporter MnhB subunit